MCFLQHNYFPRIKTSEENSYIFMFILPFLWKLKIISFYCLFPVESQITAIRTICDVEVGRLLTGIRLLRSYFSKDQLQTPVQQFFQDNYPNLAVVRNGRDGKYEVQWKEKDGNLNMNQADRGNIHASLLRRISMAYPDCSATMPFLGSCGFSSKTGIIILSSTQFLTHAFFF